MHDLFNNGIEIIKVLLISYPVSTIFFVAFFAGEPGVLFLAFLSAQNFFSPALVIIISYASALTGELFWFFFARLKLFHIVEKWLARIGISSALEKLTRHMNPGRPFKTLLIARFVSGLTIPIIIYMSRKGTNLKTFVRNCLVINFIWTPVIVLTGWLAGQGFTLLLHTIKDIEIVVSISVAVIALALIIEKKLESRIIEKS